MPTRLGTRPRRRAVVIALVVAVAFAAGFGVMHLHSDPLPAGTSAFVSRQGRDVHVARRIVPGAAAAAPPSTPLDDAELHDGHHLRRDDPGQRLQRCGREHRVPDLLSSVQMQTLGGSLQGESLRRGCQARAQGTHDARQASRRGGTLQRERAARTHAHRRVPARHSSSSPSRPSRVPIVSTRRSRRHSSSADRRRVRCVSRAAAARQIHSAGQRRAHFGGAKSS